MRFTINCPHCNSRPIARSSRQLTATMRELTFICTDPECGHTYVANLEVVRTLSPSAKPLLGIALPISQHVRARVMEQLELLPS